MKASAELSVLIIELEQDRKDAVTHDKWVIESMLEKIRRTRDAIRLDEIGLSRAVRRLAKYHQPEAN